ncbi:two-component regulator propeller domain-containing protein [Clostridium sp. YIM B02551]|uniref:ligand-binding sensor domain-containing protein n=1 Tax=Clostridium sp. YIM B02551 TaxID=2910679 RepID=UPI001EEBB22E|nr:sensor histidine kinase [Clostridium sp. YIM B02551]
MRNIARRCILFLMVCSLGLNLSVETFAYNNPKINFSRITIDDGLSQASVQTILQDKSGYMWFGTSDGLNRTDGQEFKILKYSDKQNDSISSSYISDMIEDEEDNFWVGTSNGLNKLNKDGKLIKKYGMNNSNEGLSHYNIWAVTEDKNGDIWIGTENGLDIFDKKNETFKKYFYSKDVEIGLSNNFVTALTFDDNGNAWIGTKDGLNFYDVKTKKFKRFTDENANTQLKNDYIKRLLYYDNKIWIATNGGGLSVYDISNNVFKTYVNNESDKMSLPSDSVECLYKDKDNNIWVGTDKGLALYKKDTDNFVVYNNKFYDSQSLVNDVVLSIYQDESGIMWIGTYNGVSYFNPINSFNHFKKNPIDDNSLNDNEIEGFYEDNEGVLWVGTSEGGLNSMDRKTGKVNHYMYSPTDENSISSDSVWGITGYGDKYVYIATSNGLNRFDKETGKFKRYDLSELTNGLVSSESRFLYIDSEGLLWIGTRNGLAAFNPKTEGFTYTDLLSVSNITDKLITSIYEDINGNMWFGCGLDGGLIKYNRRTDKLRIYKNEINNPKSLSINSIKSINGDSNGTIWIATNHGLNSFNVSKEEFTRYTEDEGLANDYCYGVLIDKDNNPWVSTNGGISKIDMSSNRVINYDVSDGLQSTEFNAYSFYKSKSGEMFFGGINGFNNFYPENVVKNYYLTNVRVSSFKIYDKAINFTQNIDLKYNENYFTISYFLPDYRNTKKIKYEYMLEGVDKDWVESDNRNYAMYTNVDPGKYVFKVKARNSSGIWSAPTEVEINVNNPPWKTPGAYFLYAMLLALVIYLIWNYVYILENMVNQRTVQLNKELVENKVLYNKLIENERYKNNYFINLSHELRTPLNVILSSIQLIRTLNQENKLKKEKIEQYVEVLDKNSNRLLKNINNIIDTSRIESGNYRLNLEKVDIVYLVEEVALSMKDFIESNGLELIIDPEVEEKQILCDANEIEKCIINLIGNAVKFTPENGSIYISILDLDDKIEISVKDTGVGIKKEYINIIFNRFAQAYNTITEEHGGSGLGLTLVKHLVTLHGGDIRVNSEVGKGSEFIITLPTNIEENN